MLNKLNAPHRITFYEVYDELMCLAGVDPKDGPSPDFDQIYTVFVNKTNNHTLDYKTSEPFLICKLEDKDGEYNDGLMHGFILGYRLKEAHIEAETQGKDKHIPPDTSDLERDGETLSWSLGDLRLTVISAKFSQEDWCLLARIEGRISEVALKEIVTSIRPALLSVIRCISFLHPTGSHEHISPHKIICSPGFQKHFMESEQNVSLPVIENKKTLQDQKVFIQKCIDCYYISPSKKDTFDRRIQNAVHLLTESDKQSSDAIGLALSIAAIEALLGQNEPELSLKLAERVAALLEPDLSMRGVAEEFTKKIYSNRSRTLHGEQIQSERSIRQQSRHLAAGVLFAIISRQNLLKSSGFDLDTPDKLIKALSDAKYEGNLMVGVDERNVRALWSGSKEQKNNSCQ